MDAWSLVKVVNGAMKAVGLSTGVVGTVVSGPIGVAVGATLYVKKWIDSENSKIFESVKKREGCPHIVMLEGSPPTPSAVLYVADHGGVAWKFGESALYFWHKEITFRPNIFSEAFVRGSNGVKWIRDTASFSSSVTRPGEGYGCSECRKANSTRNQGAQHK